MRWLKLWVLLVWWCWRSNHRLEDEIQKIVLQLIWQYYWAVQKIQKVIWHIQRRTKLLWNGWSWIVSSCLFSNLWAPKSAPCGVQTYSTATFFQVASAALSGLSMTPESSPLFISIMAGVAISKLSHLHLWLCASGSTKNPSAFKVTLAKLQDMGLKRVAHLLQIWWFVVIPLGEPGFQFISEARTMPNTPALVGLGASAYASLSNRGGIFSCWEMMARVKSHLPWSINS